MDERELFVWGLGILALLGSVASIIIGLSGGVLISLTAFLVYQGSSYLARSPFRVSNILSSWRPTRTSWCSKIEHGEVWIPPNIDNSLERLFERIITEYVISWYKDLTPDQEFLQEIRHLIRDVATTIIIRLNKLDITELLVGDVIPIVVQHLDGYLWAVHHTVQKGEDEQKDVRSNYVGFLGKNVHISLSSRETELEYLEDLADRIIPLVMKKENSRSKLVSSLVLGLFSRTVLLNLLDSICNPRVVNKLLSLWFSPDPIREFETDLQPPVKLLFRFVHSQHQFLPSSLHVELSNILSSQDLLCQFVQYLKTCGGVNLLNFCLAIEDFNKKIMVAELSKTQLTSLHAEARVLYQTYMKEGSSQFISFQPQLVQDIHNILQGEVREVEKLRTTPPLFRAYEQAFNNLEDNYCPGFHLSSQYLTQNFGSRQTDVRPPPVNKGGGHDRSSGRLSRFKQGLAPSPVEGSLDKLPDSGFDLASTLQNEAGSLINHDLETRDLNAWRIEIPRLEARSLAGKSCFVFIVQVKRIDVISSRDGLDLQWMVARQYHEFYTLQSALVQYHGIFEDTKLPTRAKLFSGRGLDVLQSKIEPFQEYIVKLLQKPSLKKSDLLFTFLTSQSEFTEAASQLGLTRIIKSVPKRLTKEKGQFLNGFIHSFIHSSTPQNNSVYLFGETEDTGPPEHNLNSAYKDNYSSLFPFTSSTLGPSQTFKPDGLYDLVVYACIRLLKLNSTIIRLMYAVKSLVETSFNHIVNYLLSNKLSILLNNGRVAFIVDEIQEVIFGESSELPDEEYRYQAENTLRLFRSYLPGVLRTLSPSTFDETTNTLFTLLQDPLMNKQLLYSLLETILPKLFPELKH